MGGSRHKEREGSVFEKEVTLDGWTSVRWCCRVEIIVCVYRILGRVQIWKEHDSYPSTVSPSLPFQLPPRASPPPWLGDTQTTVCPKPWCCQYPHLYHIIPLASLSRRLTTRPHDLLISRPFLTLPPSL